MSRRVRTAGLAALVAVTSLVPVVVEAGPAAPATFPGQNGPIAFVRDADGEGNGDIWMTSPDGWSVTQLTDDPANDTYPAVSPDGSTIAFSSNRSGQYQIYAMGIDGSGVTLLTADGGSAPTWSPDGAEVLFDGPGGDLWVMDADGTDPVQVTDTPDVVEVYPTWSPDGTKIAYGVVADQSIYVMDADGTDPVLLTDEIGADITSSWSPDGTRIAFACAVDGLGFPDQLCTIAPDGSHLTAVTQLVNEDGDIGVPMHPSWSPDGTKIVFRTTFGIGGQLDVMDADGTNVSPITAYEYGSNWSPSWGTGFSSKTVITSFTPDPPITGLQYAVGGTVTVDPPWGHPHEALPGSVEVSDGAQSCWANANDTETDGVYAFSCILTAGAADSHLEVTARYSSEPRWAIMPSTATEPRDVVAMPPAPSRVRISTPATGKRATVVTWTPPPGPVPVGYQIRCVPGGLSFNASPVSHPTIRWAGSVTSPVSVDGLARGLTYHCMVRARYGPEYTSEAGDGYEGPLSAWSNSVTVPVVAPPAPTGVRASTPVLPYPFTTVVSWTEVPNDTGAPVTFTTRCTSTNGGATRTAPGRSPRSIPNLSPTRRYTCTVTAANAKGSATSAPSNAVTALK